MGKKNEPLVSIVMAAYNEERYIKLAIESVLTQTYSNFEFIIINDGSTDSTEDIILNFKDSRIRYIKNKQNLKLIDSLNIGLSLATGKYIARMDADDICLPNRIYSQVDFMESNPDIGISGAQLRTFGNTNQNMNYPQSHDEIKLGLLLTSCFGNNVVIFRKEILLKNQLFFPKGYLHAEDYKSWTNWIQCTKAANLNSVLVNYRSHNNSISIQNRALQRKTRNKIRKEYLSTLFNLDTVSNIEKFFYGEFTIERINAIDTILKLNKTNAIFDQEKLKKTIFQLWYLDSLEKVETSFLTLIKFPLIFKYSIVRNFKNWINVLKHYFIFKLKYEKQS